MADGPGLASVLRTSSEVPRPEPCSGHVDDQERARPCTARVSVIELRKPGNSETPYGHLFRKTSCGVAFAHQEADYNGHYGIQEVCSICPLAQITLCKEAWVKPDLAEVTRHARALGATGPVEIDERAIIVEGLDGPTRNYLQQVFGFQCHDRNNPHLYRQHGRAPIGWEAENGTPTP
ncbi:hypothetical protein SAMN05446589_9093 [Streptomyces sp. OV198]|nr:hypothetical protein SAMN05446589_9093 [Streptomyces sp. OV198]